MGILLLGREKNLRNMQLGLAPASYFSGYSPFIDWIKSTAAPTVSQVSGGFLFGTASMWDNSNTSGAPYFDTATGDVKMPFNTNMIYFSHLVFQGQGNAAALAEQLAGGMDWPSIEMKADCASGWTLSITNLGTGGSVVSGSGTNALVFKMGNDSAPQLRCTPVGTPTVAPALRLYKKKFETLINAGQIFDPEWLAIVRGFQVLRYMDWLPTNSSTIANYSDIAGQSYKFWGRPSASASGVLDGYGLVRGMPIGVICALANITDTKIHFCIPHLATDSCVQSIATFFKSNTTKKVIYEYSNEVWNTGLGTQSAYAAAQALLVPGNPWSGDAASTRTGKYAGYRANECMKLISDIYGDRSRWEGAFATQSTNTIVTNNMITGASYFRTNSGVGGVLSDFFNDIYCTGYIGNVFSGAAINSITKANPGVVTTPVNHGLVNGQRIKLFMNSGMVELNDVFATVANKTATTFELQGIDTTSYGTFVNNTRSFYTTAVDVFDLADESNNRFIADPVTYSTKYTYFNQQVSEGLINGTAADSGYTPDASGTVAGQAANSWPDQAAIAATNGLGLKQYEGGDHFNGGTYFGGFTGGASPQHNEYILNLVWSPQFAAVLTASYEAFAAHGSVPSHFTEGGNMGAVNTFAGMRQVPEDVNNPHWRAVVAYNRGH